MMRSEEVDTHEGVRIWGFLVLQCAVPLKTNVFVDLVAIFKFATIFFSCICPFDQVSSKNSGKSEVLTP